MQSRRRKSSVNRLLVVLFLSSITLCLWLGHISGTALQVGLGSVAVAQYPNPNQLVQRGVELYQAGDISGAIAQWETALSSYRNTNNRPELAIVLENLARAYQQLGQIDKAINYWNQVIATYREMGNRQQVGRMLVEQAQAYSSSGQHRRAIAILCNPSGSENTCAKDSALQIARETKDRTLEAAALGSLGNAYRFRGDYTQAVEYLKASLKIAQEIDNLVYRASALNGLGNTYTSLALVNYRRADLAESRGDSDEADKFSQQAVSNDTKALQYLQESIETASDVPGKMRGLLNSIPAYNVSSEISAVVAKIPGSKELLDENFTRDRIQQELSQTVYPIIHIATHGEFSSQPEDTFLVTGNNGKLTITDLDTAIRRLKRETDSVELLVLTACQTAVGDDRAALGLAGVAVQAGVRSAQASLWFIQDAPTVTLVAKFYASLNNSEVSKAEALRAAQLELIEAGGQYAHPAYWAPFILIGNWL